MAATYALAVMLIVTTTTSQTPPAVPDATRLKMVPYNSMADCLEDLRGEPLGDTETATALRYRLRVIRLCAPVSSTGRNMFDFSWQTGIIDGGAVAQIGPYRGR